MQDCRLLLNDVAHQETCPELLDIKLRMKYVVCKLYLPYYWWLIGPWLIWVHPRSNRDHLSRPWRADYIFPFELFWLFSHLMIHLWSYGALTLLEYFALMGGKENIVGKIATESCSVVVSIFWGAIHHLHLVSSSLCEQPTGPITALEYVKITTWKLITWDAKCYLTSK